MPRRLLPLLAFWLAVMAGCLVDGAGRNGNVGPGGPAHASRLRDRDAIAKLLPPDVHLETVADCGPYGSNKVTVEDALVRVKARVGTDGTLRDATGKPITFYHLTGCWGNPPGDYNQLMDEQNRRLEELGKDHTVITLTCNPSGMPIP